MSHEFQSDGPGVIGSDLCQVCGKEQYEHPDIEHRSRAIAAENMAKKLKAELNEARNEANCCDDINLNQPLAGIIADLQKDREALHAEINGLNLLLAKLRELFPGMVRADGSFIVSFIGDPAQVAALLDAVLFPVSLTDEEKAKAMGENW